MGRRGGNQKVQPLTSGRRGARGFTLREESSGKTQNKGSSHNVKSMLKLQHLKELSVWASGEEASVPSLGAFFGHRFAACGAAIGVLPDPSLITCQRCETILQPGLNCTVRIEKNKAKVRRRRKKLNNPPQNNVVYKCHLCSHWNLKRGTPKGHMKEIYPPKAKPSSKSELANPKLHKPVDSGKVTGSEVETNKMDEIASPAIASDISLTNDPATPLVKTGATLLDVKKRKRSKSASKKPAETDSSSAKVDADKAVSTSIKRRRKSWTSLKEIAESGEHDNNKNIPNLLTIPFLL